MWTETDEEALLGIVALVILSPLILFIVFMEEVLEFIANNFNVIFVISVGLPIILLFISIAIRKGSFRQSLMFIITGLFAVSQLAFYLWYFEPIILAMNNNTYAGPISKIFGDLWHVIVFAIWGFYGIVNIVLTSGSEIAISCFKLRKDPDDGVFSFILGVVGWVINGILVLICI